MATKVKSFQQNTPKKMIQMVYDTHDCQDCTNANIAAVIQQRNKCLGHLHRNGKLIARAEHKIEWK